MSRALPTLTCLTPDMPSESSPCIFNHLFAFLAVGGLTGVATQVVTLSAADLPCRLPLHEGWHRAECRPNIALLSIMLPVLH